MSVTGTSQALELSLLTYTTTPRQPSDQLPASYLAPPARGTGVDVTRALRAVVAVNLGPVPGRRFVRLEVGTFDAASTYTATAGAATHTEATPATEAALLAAVAAGLNGGAVSAVVNAGGVDLLIPAGTPVSWTATGGSPDLDMTADYIGGRARLYAQHPDEVYRVAADAVPRLLADHDGTPYDYIVDADGIHIECVRCDSVRFLSWWMTNLATTGDACSPSVAGVVYRDPVARILPALSGRI